jgi:gamma-glutamyltranspeptidase/glutathione hydrolase
VRHVAVEDRVGRDAIDGLRGRGHDVEVLPSWSLGRVSAAGREGGVLKAAANPRTMQGYAVGR